MSDREMGPLEWMISLALSLLFVTLIWWWTR